MLSDLPAKMEPRADDQERESEGEVKQFTLSASLAP